MRTVLAIATMLAIAAPATASAQSHGSLGLGVVRNEALAPGSQLYGASLTVGGAMGIRLSGAILPQRTEGGLADTLSLRGWTADADLMLNLSRNRWSEYDGLSIHPYAFVGIGQMGMRDRFTDVAETWNSYSYGGGATVPVFSWLAVNGDARYRRPWERDQSTSFSAREFPRGWEYRLGISVGGGN